MITHVKTTRFLKIGVLMVMSALVACTQKTAEAPKLETPAAVTKERILNADGEPGNWLSHGRTYSEQRYSPLSQITDQNVYQLGLAWHFDLGDTRGIEATPIVVDGVMYVTGGWSKVFALDAVTGEQIWAYDPGVDKAYFINLCCEAFTRGVASLVGKMMTGVLEVRVVGVFGSTG